MEGADMWTVETVLKWLRANLVPLIFGGMLLLQFLTWREVANLPHACRLNYCTVEIDGTVELSRIDRALLSDIAHK
jgi:hypothetical protein